MILYNETKKEIRDIIKTIEDTSDVSSFNSLLPAQWNILHTFLQSNEKYKITWINKLLEEQGFDFNFYWNNYFDARLII